MIKIGPGFEVDTYYLKDDGIFPNNDLPVLHYRNVLQLPTLLAVTYIEHLFKKNNWTHAWKSGIFEYHHYHSITHEVLGVYSGEARLLLGGENGIELMIGKGDVVIIPAGVAHKNLDPEDFVKCVGAYPDGKAYDMNYGLPEERPQVDENISKVEMPPKDPVFGVSMKDFWKQTPN